MYGYLMPVAGWANLLPNSECLLLNGHYVAVGLINWWVDYGF